MNAVHGICTLFGSAYTPKHFGCRMTLRPAEACCTTRCPAQSHSSCRVTGAVMPATSTVRHSLGVGLNLLSLDASAVALLQADGLHIQKQALCAQAHLKELKARFEDAVVQAVQPQVAQVEQGTGAPRRVPAGVIGLHCSVQRVADEPAGTTRLGCAHIADAALGHAGAASQLCTCYMCSRQPCQHLEEITRQSLATAEPWTAGLGRAASTSSTLIAGRRQHRCRHLAGGTSSVSAMSTCSPALLASVP